MATGQEATGTRAAGARYQVRIYDHDFREGRTWITGTYAHCAEILAEPCPELVAYLSQPKRWTVNIVPVRGVRR